MIHTCRNAVLAFLLALAFLPQRAEAQFTPIVGNSPAPGVYVEPDGTVKRREVDEKSELATMRLRVKLAADAAKDPKVAYVSLPKAFAAGKPIPEDVRFIGGLTQISFIFVYGDEQDLVVAGPAEPFKVMPGDDGYAIGTRTGRPVMRLEDLVVAMRVVQAARGNAFGCQLDRDPAAPQLISDARAKMAKATRAVRVKAVQDATGPQKVSFFGAVPPDTRFALTTVAADYELKRYGLGLARHTVPGLDTIVDSTRQAVNMIWFQLAYEPILMSADGDAYGLRGPRLSVQAGSFDWDPKGATPKAFQFAKKMSDNLEALATQQPLVADLQSLADLSVVAALIQRDKLDRKVGWDTAWILQATGDSLSSFPVNKVVTPKNADALANYSNGAIAAGGVMLIPNTILSMPTQVDDKKVLESAKAKGADLRKQKAGAAVVGP